MHQPYSDKLLTNKQFALVKMRRQNCIETGVQELLNSKKREETRQNTLLISSAIWLVFKEDWTNYLVAKSLQD